MSRRSSTDKIVAGVCGGLGEATGIPCMDLASCLLTCILMSGFGILPYAYSLDIGAQGHSAAEGRLFS